MGVVLSSQRSPSPRVVPDTPTRSRCRRHPILSPGALQSWISPLISFTLCSNTSIPRAVSPSPSRPRPHTTASSAVHCDECATRPPRAYRSRPPIYCWRRTGVVNPYFCSACSQFHLFSPQWRATDHELVYHLYAPEYPRVTNQKTWATFEPTRGYGGPNQSYAVPYALARLVMNRHWLGAPRGLPLDCLGAKYVKIGLNSDLCTWTQTWRARIIDNALFLSSFHTFSQLAVGHAFAARFRKGFDKRDNFTFTPGCVTTRLSAEMMYSPA